MMMPYHAAPLPERERPVVREAAAELRPADSCFAFSRGDFGFTAYELSGSGRYLLRVDLCGSASALIAFSQ